MFDEILVSNETKDVVLVFKEKEYKFKLKDLSWSVRNRIISKCMIVSEKSVTLDIDRYYRMSLKEMIAEAPWDIAKTDEVLSKLDGNFGYSLQRFVPNPYGNEPSGEEIPKN